MAPLLSIIVPVYGVEKYIRQCVDSILKQTFVDFELILVDDGSLDNCPQICDEYAQKDHRIQVIHQENGGLVAARKSGLSLCQGTYIGIVDGDDWIDQTMFEKMVKAAQQTQADIVVCDTIEENGTHTQLKSHGIFEGFFTKQDLIKEVYPKMLYTGEYYVFGVMPALWNKLYKRDILINAVSKVDKHISLGEDVAAIYPALLEANSLYILPNCQALYHYRILNQSMSRRYDKNLFDKNHVLFTHLKRVFTESEYSHLLQPQLNYYIAYLALEAVQNEFRLGNEHSFWKKYHTISQKVSDSIIAEAYHAISLRSIHSHHKILLFGLKHRWYWFITCLLSFNQSLRLRQKRGIKDV